MALITDHASLLAAVADTLNRTDLTSVIPNFIQQAHDSLELDPRVRKLTAATLTMDADDEAVPADFESLESMSHDGTTYFGDLEIVGPGQISEKKRQFGTTGPPAFVAVVDAVFRFAPVPDASYSLKTTYWATLASIVSSANWLLTNYPSIYLYATLIESAPYLKDDERVAVWSAMLEDRLEKLHQTTWDAQWGGNLRRQFDAIGG